MDSLAIRNAVSQGGKDAEYLLVHIVETAGAMWYGSEIADRESREDLKNLENYVAQLTAEGYRADLKIEYGNPRRKIPDVTAQFEADLLVMGAHGHQVLKDLIFGATVDVVRHRVRIPVLIVRG